MLESLDSDPEAGSYVAHFSNTPENQIKAQKFADIIIWLIENEAELYRMVKEEGHEIQWD